VPSPAPYHTFQVPPDMSHVHEHRKGTGGELTP
jgi:cytochrome c oxidase subunit 1